MVETVRLTTDVSRAGGDGQVRIADVMTVAVVARVSNLQRTVEEAEEGKLLPVMVSIVPPETGPRAGVTLVNVGAGVYV